MAVIGFPLFQYRLKEAEMKFINLWFVPIFLFLSGCSGVIHEIVTSEPAGANIFWGKTSSNLRQTDFRTPHARKISASAWEPWCYQIVMEGYQDSEIICREEESHRHISVLLNPVETMITSDPPGAVIYWGPSADDLRRTSYFTPHNANLAWEGANWKDWYFQVRRRNFQDSEVIFLPQSKTNRQVNFKLKPIE